MKISEYFNLVGNQEIFEFFDVELSADNYRFLDAFYIDTLDNSLCKNAKRYIKSFFQDFLVQLENGNSDGAKALFTHLHEDNSTRLGMSIKDPQGKGIGDLHAERIYEAIEKSELFTNGIANDFEDVALFLKWIDKDKMSDMITNIIREILANFTNAQCELYDIPTAEKEIEYWSIKETNWVKGKFQLPVDSKGKYLLFVPKDILTKHTHYTFSHFLFKSILPVYQEIYKKQENSIVKKTQLKDGTYKLSVSKKDVLADLKKKMTVDKEFAIKFTKEHPEALKKFKKEMKNEED